MTGRDPVAPAALGTLVGAVAVNLVSPPWELPWDQLALPSALKPPGWLLLGETLNAPQLAGAGVLLTGVVLAQLPGRATPPVRWSGTSAPGACVRC
ncbi:hypothetical protein [Crossiella sp. NPDC003009]